MKTQIFAYRGAIGATTDIENGKFINNPKDPGELGCVIHTNECQITKEAKELLRNAPREGGSFSGIMLTKHADGSGSSIGLMGFWKHIFVGRDLSIGRDCDVSVLDNIEEVDIEIPEGFKEAIDNYYATI